MGRPGLTQHRKFRRLARALGGDVLARGSLELLWDSCYEAGDDFLGDSEDVEAAARWTGAPGLLTKALLSAGGEGSVGFIEEIEGRSGMYRVHDLWHHAPDYVRKRRRREDERRAKAGPVAPDGGQWSAGDRSADGQRQPSPDCQDGLDLPPSPSPSPSPLKENLLSKPKNGFDADVAANGSPKPDEPLPVTSEAEKPATVTSKAEQVIGIWNETAKGTNLPTCRLTSKREKIIRVRLKEKGWLEDFRAACMFLRSSGFHRGQNDSGWKASVDFVLQAGKATELAEKSRAAKVPANGGEREIQETASEKRRRQLLKQADPEWLEEQRQLAAMGEA